MKRNEAGGGYVAMMFMVLLVLALMAPVASAAVLMPPSIKSESATNVTSTDATLGAQINPNGSYTAYQFQIDMSGSYDFTQMACPLEVPGYAQCLGIIVGEPLPPGLAEPEPSGIAAGAHGKSVSVDLASIGAILQPETTYHYRVIAANSDQMVNGPDQTFTTPETGAFPLVESVVGTGGGAQAVPLSTALPPQPVSRKRSHRRPRHKPGHRRSKG